MLEDGNGSPKAENCEPRYLTIIEEGSRGGSTRTIPPWYPGGSDDYPKVGRHTMCRLAVLTGDSG